MDSNQKYENKSLTEYRLKVNRTKWFLHRFCTPYWLQKTSKIHLIVALVCWGIGMLFVLFNSALFQANAAIEHPLVNLMVTAATITVLGMCFSYFNRRRKD